MLDVHPPHEAAHTWKDFLIHIATITVGLLIAIGLEQTVELFHHRHQRHQLEAQLRIESLHNMNLALQNLDRLTEFQARIIAQYTELQAATSVHRTPQWLHRLSALNIKPASTAWVVAQQNATLGLLPLAESQRYVRVYSVVDSVNSSLYDELSFIRKTDTALWPALLFDKFDPQGPQAPTYDLSRMTADQLRLLSESLAELGGINSYCINRNRLLYGVNWAAWRGYANDEETVPLVFAIASVPGGKAAMLARYPLPEEAKHLTTDEGDR